MLRKRLGHFRCRDVLHRRRGHHSCCCQVRHIGQYGGGARDLLPFALSRAPAIRQDYHRSLANLDTGELRGAFSSESCDESKLLERRLKFGLRYYGASAKF